jgi:hypothetical protein
VDVEQLQNSNAFRIEPHEIEQTSLRSLLDPRNKKIINELVNSQKVSANRRDLEVSSQSLECTHSDDGAHSDKTTAAGEWILSLSRVCVCAHSHNFNDNHFHILHSIHAFDPSLVYIQRDHQQQQSHGFGVGFIGRAAAGTGGAAA